MHKTYAEGGAVLDRILDNAPFVEPIEPPPEEAKRLEEPSTSEPSSDLDTSISSNVEPSPEPGISKEGEIQTSIIPFEFEDDCYEDFGNTSNYQRRPKPPIPISPPDPLDEQFLKETIKELTLIMSGEWLEEVEDSPPSD